MNTLTQLKIHHIGFVVENLTESMEHFKTNYCIESFQTWEFNPMAVKVDGVPVKEYKLKIAMGSIGGKTKMEIIEPVTPTGCHYDFIQKKMKGMHHLCFTTDKYDYWYSHFENKKLKFIFEAEIEDDIIGYRRCFYAEDIKIGLIFELREEPYFRNID